MIYEGWRVIREGGWITLTHDCGHVFLPPVNADLNWFVDYVKIHVCREIV